MFSGIIESLGPVRKVEPGAQSVMLEVETGLRDVAEGESIAVNGVCLTATAPSANGLVQFFVSSETLDRTTLGALRVGSFVNLERAVTPATRLSGHIVQGHVDGTATFVESTPSGDAHRVVFEVPASLRRYMVEKGSITLDGISLTLNELSAMQGDTFRIALMIIPHTWTHTNLGKLVLGDAVNVEVDVIAKYVEALCQNQ
ncbi:riboflavin synthase [Acetobacter orleanensis]|uniref:Riboflavin synthase n=1 Tax=Acetobacter orleanensis TaxID=104099 RepID=A0A4Y3TRS2_9PROT|nr:riboflavin synthase [Acetobacter orleanensis]KXV66393.1 riboflavin synthase subunit alpha [Acetobacter orleanensis]PCD78761.1 riboflavin synthase [Acetobacter orleanensis]GAN67947.1 riboflavin synthase subunit alpha [Acetobacter orleanensis JCM 7639]GBR29523.1 riboflavin synthase subunit alpha [Acetobacter orleanensis NRIC 0473]GEB83777.1 riboflavin synthase subunit alpha [Acetobacter orleanensis]